MRKVRILVVEDNIIIAESIKKRLEGLKYSVAGIVGSGEEALEITEQERPDLVLMDIMLQGEMDGVETAEIIRREYLIPVIYLTAFTDDNTLRRAKVTEPFGYLVKPFKEKELHTNIEIALYRSKVEKKLKESEEKYRLLIENAGVGFAMIDKDSSLLMVNNIGAKDLGGKPEDFIGKSLSEIFTGEKAEENLKKIDDVVSSGTGRTFEMSVDSPTGQRWFSVNIQPIVDTNEKVSTVQIVYHDITETRKFEEERQKINRFETISTLSEGIAHDFTNYMTAIMGNISIAKMYSKKGEEVFERLEKAEKASMWAQDLIQQLLDFSRGEILQKQNTDISKVLVDTVNFALSFSNCACTFLVPDDLWKISIDRCQISQVINNVIINAHQAMPDGGNISVSAENVTITGKESMPLKKGKYVKIIIEDEGMGIPPENLLRIFDPYFSTKPEGSGLGLAVSYSQVKHHEGYLTAESEPGKGTRIFVYLPVSHKETQEKEVESVTAGEESGEGKILLVDDEKPIRDMVGNLLSTCGYEVIFASDGQEALDICEEACVSGGLPDLIILDLMLPDKDGFEVCSYLKGQKEFSAIPIIILSAKRQEADKVLGLELGVDDYITKPFSTRELLARIKMVLRRKEPPLTETTILKAGKGLEIDLDKYKVFSNGKAVELTPTEFKIIKLLSGRKGWVFTREQILDYLWGNEKAVFDRTINVHIKHLREKLGETGKYIKSVRGLGYKLED